MTISKFYRDRGENVIKSYSFTDIIEGTGTVVFNGYKGTDSTGEVPGMNQTDFFADPKVTNSDNMDQGSFTVESTTNFDSAVLNSPLRIEGTCYIEGSFAVSGAGGTSSTQGKVTFTLQKWDGLSATTIGTATTEDVVAADSDGTIITFVTDTGTLTKTTVQRGEQIRMKAEIYGKKTSGGGTGNGHLAHDPQNRDISTSETGSAAVSFTAADNHTWLRFYIPFKIDT